MCFLYIHTNSVKEGGAGFFTPSFHERKWKFRDINEYSYSISMSGIDISFVVLWYYITVPWSFC